MAHLGGGAGLRSMLRRREVLDEQRGAIMLVMALLLVVLLGVAGFAVDLGWLLWNSIEVQHGPIGSSIQAPNP